MTIIRNLILGIGALVASAVGLSASNVVMHTPANFQVMSLSPNAKWACGVYVDPGSNSTYGFRWNLEGGSIEMLDVNECTAFDIANDGTISGEFSDTKAIGNGAPSQMPGYWRDGKWHSVEMPEGTLLDGICYGISTDGQYITGAVSVDGLYKSYIWKNGQIHRKLPALARKNSVPFAVSPDGNAAAGFMEKYNRTACYWAPDGTVVYFEDSPEYSQTPWNYARQFSPDGSKLLYWGGWYYMPEEDERNFLYSIYEIATGERIRIPAQQVSSEMEFFDVSNNGVLVGLEGMRGYVWTGTEGLFIDDYLANRGADLSQFDDFYDQGAPYDGIYPIYRIVAISEDEDVIVGQYYNKNAEVASIVIKMDQDLTAIAPAEVNASQLSGLNTVGITWKRPAGLTSLRGYNVYRDGVKISGFLPLNRLYYYDRNLAPGTYVYQVSVVGMNGEETRCDEQTVTVDTNVSTSPMHLFARQKGINSGRVTWDEPLSNSVHKHYYNPEINEYAGIYIYDPLEIEAAVRYDKNEMANYAGYTVNEVSFVPMSEQNDWTIRFYTYDSDGLLNILAEQPVEQELNYKTLNTVKLDTPLTLPTGDLIVAIGVSTKWGAGMVIGAEGGPVEAGYTDLMRQVDEDDFFSLFNRSIENGMGLTFVTWAIDLGLKPAEQTDDSVIDHYRVYLDGAEAAVTIEPGCDLPSLEDGDHTVGVEAVYTDGSVTRLAETNLSITGAFMPVDDVKVDVKPGTGEVTASWDAPVHRDNLWVSYSKAETHAAGIHGNETNDYALMAGAIYPARMMKGYAGHRIKSFRFYPLDDALFTFMLYENDELIYTLEVEDYTWEQWNEVELPDDIRIKPNADYKLVVDCFGALPDFDILGIDNVVPYAYMSDLYSITYGETWNSLNIETGAVGNWMMGMTLEDPEAVSEATGYDVIIDGRKCNSEPIGETSYTYDLGEVDDVAHSLRMDVYYKTRTEAVEGQPTVFYLQVSGIESNMVADLRLTREAGYLAAEGDGVEAMAIYTVAGVMVASGKGDRIAIGDLAAGSYLVKITVDGRTVTRKVRITRW